MGTPALDQFIDYVSTCTGLVDAVTKDPASKAAYQSMKPTKEAILAFMQASLNVDEQSEQQIRAHPVERWIVGSQPGRKAYKGLFDSGPEVDLDGLAQAVLSSTAEERKLAGLSKRMRGSTLTFEESMARFKEENAERVQIDKIKSWCLRLSPDKNMQLRALIGSAFQRYLYADLHIEIFNEAKRLPVDVLKARSAIKTLLEGREGSGVPLSLDSELRQGLIFMDSNLEAAMQDLQKRGQPIQRMDSTAPERALAFVLWEGIYERFTENKTSAICDLVSTVQVERPPSIRKVSEWVREFRKTRGLE